MERTRKNLAVFTQEHLQRHCTIFQFGFRAIIVLSLIFVNVIVTNAEGLCSYKPHLSTCPRTLISSIIEHILRALSVMTEPTVTLNFRK